MYLNGLNIKERCDDYEIWKIIIWGIANVSRDNKWSSKVRNELIHNFSKRSDNYDEYKVDDFIDNHIKDIKDGIGIGTIVDFYKKDNKNVNDKNEITLDYILCNNIRDNDIAKYIKHKLYPLYYMFDIIF